MSYIVGTEKIIKGLEHIFTLMSPRQRLYALIHPSLAYGDDGLGILVSASDFLELEISMLDEARGSPENFTTSNIPKVKPVKKTKDTLVVSPIFRNEIDDEIDEEEFPYLK